LVAKNNPYGVVVLMSACGWCKDYVHTGIWDLAGVEQVGTANRQRHAQDPVPKNRQEWEDRGLEVVAGLVKDTQAKLAAENLQTWGKV
jgi:hypothetical protein